MRFCALLLTAVLVSGAGCAEQKPPENSSGRPKSMFMDIPPEYLREPDEIPAFWISTVEDVNRFLDERVGKGRVETIGTSAGGRPIRAASYGHPRQGRGTTTFSGSAGLGDVRAYLGPDHGKKVFLGMAGVHGGEFEGIVGAVNLLSVLETGKDLRGKEWPGVAAAAARLDRIVVIPIVNVDGRTRVPIRMEAHRGTSGAVHEYLNTGGLKDGSNIGWPACKKSIPLDFSRVQFPGGYPNDAGVNIQHDDFLGAPQPETRALFDLTAPERPDLIFNMHTHGNYTSLHRPFMEPALTPVFTELYRRVHTRLAVEGLRKTKDPKIEADPARAPQSAYNLDTALNLHCGALSVVIEAASHGFTPKEPSRNKSAVLAWSGGRLLRCSGGRVSGFRKGSRRSTSKTAPIPARYSTHLFPDGS